MTTLHDLLSVRDLAAAYRARRPLSPIEVTEYFLERIDRIDSDVRSMVTVTPEARHSARCSRRTTNRTGRPESDARCPGRDQGPHRREGRAHHRRQRRTPRQRRDLLVRRVEPPRSRRSRTARQGEHPRVRVRRHHRTDRQPVGEWPPRRGLVRWTGGRARRRADAAGCRHRHRRVDPHPREPVRRLRPQAHPWRRERFRRDSARAIARRGRPDGSPSPRPRAGDVGDVRDMPPPIRPLRTQRCGGGPRRDVFDSVCSPTPGG